jgi:sialate O-acetylesterase
MSNVGLAVTIDLGEWNDIHPLNKKSVGDRLALQAEKIAYKKCNCRRPVYESMKIEGNKIILTFKKGTDNLQPTSDLKAFL